VTGTASESQLVGMEGLKTVLIRNSTLSSSQTGKTASDPVADGVIIYQSTSGDAESTTGEAATFQAVDSKLSSAIQSGSMFYLTNTSADVVLKNTELDFASSAARLLYAAGNDANNWGQAGSNGATVKFTGIGQQLAGDVVADTISSVDLHLTEGTTWAGAASIEQNAAGSTSDAPMTVNIDGSSQWTVTADSTVSSLNVAEGAKVVDADGKTVTIVAGGQTVVQGDSGLTVTVTGSYSTDYDASEAGSLTSEAIDRTAYDDAFGTDVDDASSDEKDATSQASTASDTDSGSSSDAEKGFFAQVALRDVGARKGRAGAHGALTEIGPERDPSPVAGPSSRRSSSARAPSPRSRVVPYSSRRTPRTRRSKSSACFSASATTLW